MKTLALAFSLQLGVAVVAYGPCATPEEQPQPTKTLANAVQPQLPAGVQIAREPDLSSLSPSDAKYLVRCEILSDALSFHTPGVTVRDGERVTLSDKSESPYTVAVLRGDNCVLPITRKLSEGSEFEFTVLAIDDQSVLVDVQATLEGVQSAEAKETPQAVQVKTLQGRFLETMRLGESASAKFGDQDTWTLKVSVRRVQDSNGDSTANTSEGDD